MYDGKGRGWGVDVEHGRCGRHEELFKFGLSGTAFHDSSRLKGAELNGHTFFTIYVSNVKYSSCESYILYRISKDINLLWYIISCLLFDASPVSTTY